MHIGKSAAERHSSFVSPAAISKELNSAFEQQVVLRTPKPTGLRDLVIDQSNRLIAFGSGGKIFRWDLVKLRAELAKFNLDWATDSRAGRVLNNK